MQRAGSTKVVIIVIACVLGFFLLAGGLIVAAIVIPAVKAVNHQAQLAQNLEQVRGMGNAFALYYKKFSYYPALVDMTQPTTDAIAIPRAKVPHCLALKLFLKDGFVEDPKVFFSPRGPAPDDATLASMTKNPDPWKDPTWAGTYAYDPGHNPNHGLTPIFGDAPQVLNTANQEDAHVLTAEMVAKEVGLTQGGYLIANHAEDSRQTVGDDIYADDSATLGWRDSFLVNDVPATLP